MSYEIMKFIEDENKSNKEVEGRSTGIILIAIWVILITAYVLI